MNRRRSFDRRLAILFAIVFVNFLGAGMVQPVLPLYASREFGASPELIALLLSSFFMAQFLAAPFLGRLSDRTGRLPVLIGSQIGTVISFGLMALSTSIGGLFAARIIDGITGGNIIVAQAYITDITTREKRTQSLGLIFAAFGLGNIFGPALGGTIAAAFGAHGTFFVAALVSILTVTLTRLFLRESLPPERRAERKAVIARMTVRDVTGNNPLLIILFIGFCAQFSIAILQATLALFGEAIVFADSPVSMQSLGVGLLLTAVGLGQFITQLFFLRPAVKRFGERRLVVVGAFFRALGMWSMVVLTAPLLLGSVSMMTIAISSGLMMPSLQSLATTTSAEEISGGVLGVYNSATTLGMILGMALAGVLFSIGPRVPYLAGGAMLMFTVLPALALQRTLRLRAARSLA
ncbi:MAG TPA: MFS transporter [Candidatus Limnocylindrales bacterium]|nr:MFS transporter [Candidatus Limnocylindrales bacterium]